MRHGIYPTELISYLATDHLFLISPLLMFDFDSLWQT